MKYKNKPEAVLDEEQTVEKVLRIGFVSDCNKLRVRKEPTFVGESLMVLDKGTEVRVDDEASTDRFYKIYTSSGFSGYCMKDFIRIEE